MTPFVYWKREPLGWITCYFDQDAAPSPSGSRPEYRTGQPVDPRIAKAGDLLLKHGGHSLGLLPTYETADRLVARGHVFTGPRRKLKNVPPNLCHITATLRYMSDRANLRLATGCVLTKGLWTHHTWTMAGDVILDPLTDEGPFYGYLLDGDETAFWVADVEKRVKSDPDLARALKQRG